ncbi:MAG: hypothetical protein ACOX6T_20970 [Myxococcales bacterium]
MLSGLSDITSKVFDNVIDHLIGDNNTLDQIKSVFSDASRAESTDTFTEHQSSKSLTNNPRMQVEWMGFLGKYIGVALEKLTAGYATSSEEWNKKFSDSVNVLRNNFDLLDTAAGVGGKDGFIGKNDLEAAMRNPNLPKEIRDACRFLLNNPSAWNQLDVGAGIGKCDGIIGRCDVDAVWAKLAEQAPPAESADPSTGGTNAGGGVGETGGTGSAPSSEWSQKFSDAVNVLKDNFDLLDTAAGIGGKDGFIGKNDLLAALRNPNLPKELKDACRFLLTNPAAWNQLDVGAGIGKCDGIIAKCDVDAVLAKLAEQTPPVDNADQPPGTEDAGESGDVDDTRGPDETGETGETGETEGTTGTSGPSTEETSGGGTSNDTSTTTSLQRGSRGEGTEGRVTNLLNDLDDAIEEKTAALDEMIRSGAKDTHTAFLELQRLVEARKLMFELLSTLSRLNNEMAKTAIQNMGRA